MKTLKIKIFRILETKYFANYTSNNKVDKDVQSMLLSLNLLQYITFLPKYSIKNGFISPNSCIIKFVSLIVTLAYICLFILTTYMISLKKDSLGYTTFMYVSSFYDCFFYGFGFALNYWVGIIQTNKSIRFVLNFQRVHRFLNKDSSVKQFVVSNWIIVIAVVLYVIVTTCLHIQLGVLFCSIYTCYLILMFDFNIFYATRIIKLLENKLNLWNIRVLNSQVLEDGNEEGHSKQLFQAYVDILECYNIYKDGFQQLILFYIVEVLFQSLVDIQITIETFKKDIMNENMNETTLLAFYVLFYMMKDLMWASSLVQQCEKFYFAIQNVQDTCVLIRKTTFSDEEKKLCKNVLRLHRASFNKLRVCGLFHIDAALHLSLMSLLTTYTVVLLQFAFL